MKNIIVTLKQVPDIKEVDDNAFNKETGTLIRTRLKNVLNELDDQALSFANRLRTLTGAEKIVCLTMGPPIAEEILRYAISKNADDVILLTDRALGGADTVATASTLASAIKKIEKDIFNGDKDYCVISGMQSVDGDTAQVPPQIAADLKIPCIPYVVDVEKQNSKICFSSLLNDQNIKYIFSSLPSLITVSKYDFEVFPSFSKARYQKDANVITWNAEDIKENARFIGGEGSKTQVVKVFAPTKSKKRQEQIHDIKDLVKIIKESVNSSLDKKEEKQDDYVLTDGTQTTYNGEVFVLCEVNNNQVERATFELIGKARDLAISLNTKASCLLIGSDVTSLSNDLIKMGADKVYVVDSKKLETFDPNIYSDTICKVFEKHAAQIVLFSATLKGRILAPLTSYKLECGLTADCTGLSIGDDEKKGKFGILMQTRPALGGNIMATICTKNSKIQMATVRPGVMKELQRDETRAGEIINLDIEISDDKSFEILKFDNDSENKNVIVNFSKEIVVGGGRGLQNRENFKKNIIDFSKALSNKLSCKASFGGSRVAVEQGYCDRVYQIGQTGTTIAPKVYIACAISGAIQHIVGINSSDIIIAINNDKDAPIFKESDFYYIGDVNQVIPEILENL